MYYHADAVIPNGAKRSDKSPSLLGPVTSIRLIAFLIFLICFFCERLVGTNMFFRRSFLVVARAGIHCAILFFGIHYLIVLVVHVHIFLDEVSFW